MSWQPSTHVITLFTSSSFFFLRQWPEKRNLSLVSGFGRGPHNALVVVVDGYGRGPDNALLFVRVSMIGFHGS